MRYTIRYIFLLFLMLPSILSATEVEEVVSDYGFRAWMMEDHSLPIVSLHMAFKHTGTAYDPEGKEGLANMVVSLLGEGTEALDAVAFKKELESRAIKLSFDVDEDTIYITIKTLTEHMEKACELLQQVLLSARFGEEDIARVKQQTLTTLAARKESAEYVARKAFREMMFGEHPYAKPDLGTKESLQNINKQDLKLFVEKHFNRASLVIGVVGDIRPKRLPSLLDTYFVELPLSKPKASVLPHYTKMPKASEKIISMDVPQSTAIFGHGGIKRDHPDFYPAYIVNHILGGGGFESRLMQTVRENKGLAYSVYSYLNTMEYAGLFQGMVASQNAKINESLAIIKEEIQRMKTKGITDKELADAKSYLIGSFPLRLDKNDKLARFLIGMQLENLGIDFLEKRNSYVEAVTRADVNRVAGTLLDSENLSIVVVGNPEEISMLGVGNEKDEGL